MKDYKRCESAAIRITKLGVTKNIRLYSSSVNTHLQINILRDFGKDLVQGYICYVLNLMCG